MMIKDLKRNKTGFSLIELIVVIAILAVMVLVLAPKLLSYNERSRAEKDNSSMDEVVNAIQLALADQEIYDEVLRFSTVDNVSCYVDTNSESNYSKIVTKANPDGIDQYTFLSDARTLDETPYFAAGNMRGVTITFAPDKGSNGSIFDLKQGVVNQYIQVSGNQRFGALPKLYNRVRSSVGDEIFNTSQTYRNSEYTVFIVMGTIGGNDESAQDATKLYGQWSGTNLPAVVSYQLVTDRVVGDTGNAIVDIDDNKWNETNGNKLTLKPGDLNGGGSFDQTTADGNQEPDQINTVTGEVAGLYDADGNLLVKWGKSGIDVEIDYNSESSSQWYYSKCVTSPYYVIKNNYPTAKKVVLPDGIKNIGDYSFYFVSLNEIVFSDEITRFGKMSLAATGISNINMPDSLLEIDDSAFAINGYLDEITLPNNLKRIGMGAFTWTGLSTIHVPASVENIEEGAFYNINNLQSITVDGTNANYCIYNKTLFSKDKKTLHTLPSAVSGITTYNIPSGTTRVAKYALYGAKNVKYVNFASTVEDIGQYAFANCSNLQYVTIPSKITKLEPNTFQNCSSMYKVTFHNAFTEIGDRCFQSCALSSVTFPSSLKKIGEWSFAYNGNLSVTFPSYVTHIEEYAFEGCKTLYNQTLPSTIEYIGKAALSVDTMPTYLTYAGTTYRANPNYYTNPYALNLYDLCDVLHEKGIAAGGSLYIWS